MSIKTEEQLTPKTAYSREFCEKHFGPRSSGKAAMELKRSSPETYSAVRAASVQYGLLDAQREHPWAQQMRERAAKSAPRSYTDEEILARAAFSEARCKELLGRSGNEGSKDNLTRLKANSPEIYAKFKAAAVSYGLLAPGAIQHAKTPALQTQLQQTNNDASAGLIAISDSLADSLRLPRGTKVEQGRLSSLIELSGSIEAAREALKAEAEKVAVEGDK